MSTENMFAEETNAVDSVAVVKLTNENRDDFTFADEDNFEDATFSSLMPEGYYLARVTEHSIKDGIVINGVTYPKDRTIHLSIVFDVKNGKPMERKMSSSFYLRKKDGSRNPTGIGQLVMAYATMRVQLDAEQNGTTVAGFNKAKADAAKQFVAGQLSQKDIRDDSEGALFLVYVKVRAERMGKNAEGADTLYPASNEVNWDKAKLISPAIMDAYEAAQLS